MTTPAAAASRVPSMPAAAVLASAVNPAGPVTATLNEPAAGPADPDGAAGAR